MRTTKYAKSGHLSIAYQVVGDGPVDLVFAPWWWNNLEIQWEDPLISRFLNRLASFSRLIIFDQRGTGLSDPISLYELPSIEQWMDDVRAVMDAAGSERAAIFGHGDGGLVSMLFAATYPDRTSSLVLADASACIRADADYPSVDDAWLDQLFVDMDEGWGSGVYIEYLAPDLAKDTHFRERVARLERLSVSPGAAIAIQRMVVDLDLRPFLPTISSPTLVLHRKDNLYAPACWGRYLADHIRGARYVELPGNEHFYWVGASETLLDEVEEFLTGQRPPVEADRILASILFTDIVGSTERAVQLGDRAWRDLLDRFRTTVRRLLDRFRGREMGTAGDDFLVTFDGPARAIRCALAITESARSLGLDVRSGLHTGEVELMGKDIGGIAVHIGARVSALAKPGEVLVSRTVVDLVAGSGIRFADGGEHTLKGVPGSWHLFSVTTAPAGRL